MRITECVDVSGHTEYPAADGRYIEDPSLVPNGDCLPDVLIYQQKGREDLHLRYVPTDVRYVLWSNMY